MPETPDAPKLADVAGPPKTETIKFHDRPLTVRVPNLEQFHAFQRIMGRVEKGRVDDWTGEDAMKMLNRMRGLIDSVLVDPADVEWLDDQMLEGSVDMQEAMTILIEAVKAFHPEKADQIDQVVSAELVK